MIFPITASEIPALEELLFLPERYMSSKSTSYDSNIFQNCHKDDRTPCCSLFIYLHKCSFICTRKILYEWGYNLKKKKKHDPYVQEGNNQSIPRNTNDIIEKMNTIRMGTWEYQERGKKNVTAMKKQWWFEDFLNRLLHVFNTSKHQVYWRHTHGLISVQVYNLQITWGIGPRTPSSKNQENFHLQDPEDHSNSWGTQEISL